MPIQMPYIMKNIFAVQCTVGTLHVLRDQAIIVKATQVARS